MSDTMTYTILTGTRGVSGSIKEWTNHNSIPVDQILDRAESWIYKRLRVRPMLTSTSGTATASATEITLPSDWEGPRTWRWRGTNLQGEMEIKTLDEIEDRIVLDGDGAIASGAPMVYAVDESSIVLPVRMFEAVPFKYRYYRRLPGLSTDTDTNFLTEEYPNLLHAVCMAQAEQWKKNWNGAKSWFAEAQDHIFEANHNDDEELLGADLAMEIP